MKGGGGVAREGAIVGLDVGTSKVAAVIGEIDDKNQVEIIGVGISPSIGLRKGIIVDLESTTNSIRRAISSAETLAGLKVESVIAGVAGEHIKGSNHHGVVSIPNRRSRFVSESDVKRVINQAKDIEMPADRLILDAIPREFVVDDQKGIMNPIGMAGARLEALIHIITGASNSVQNVVKAVENAGLKVDNIILQPLASSDAVLGNDEKELGVILIDIGAGTTDIVVYAKGSIRYTGVIPIGGEQVTNDIAIGLRTPIDRAEEIKKNFGCAVTSMIDSNETIEVPGVGGRKPKTVPRSALIEIIEPRIEEILEIIYREVGKYGNMIHAGIVMTGGASMLNGLPEFTEKMLNMQVRIGYPIQVTGLTDKVNDPVFATGIGLVLHGAMGFGNGRIRKWNIKSDRAPEILGKIKDWFSSYF